MRPLAPFLLTLSVSALLACDGSGIVDPTVAPDGAHAAKGGISAPTAPSNVTVADASDSRIDVAWQDNSSNESGFEVHRSTNGAAGSFTLRATAGANAVLHIDDGLEGGREYCYRVRTTRLTGTKVSHSSFSNTACATTSSTPLPPAAPSNLVAIGASETEIDLAWQDRSSDESSFHVRRSNGTIGPFYHVATKSANSIAHTDQSLTAGTLYCYYVVAVRESTTANGTTSTYSANSNTACASPVPPTLPPPPTEPPPSAYVVTAIPSGSSLVMVTVAWNDTSVAPSFRLYRSLDGVSSWELITASNNYWDSPVEQERTVCYRAVAYNAAGDSDPSSASCVVPPAGPTNLVTSLVDATTLELRWSDNSAQESGYEVWTVNRWRSDCFSAGYSEWEVRVASLPANATSWRTAAVAPSCHDLSVYYVVAVRDGGRSDPSDEVSTAAPAP